MGFEGLQGERRRGEEKWCGGHAAATAATKNRPRPPNDPTQPLLQSSPSPSPTTHHNHHNNQDVALKQRIFADLEAATRPDCVLATNTSTIDIDLVGAGTKRARDEGRVVGAHFFSPAHVMPLLEIVRTERTSKQVRVVRVVWCVVVRVAALWWCGVGAVCCRWLSWRGRGERGGRRAAPGRARRESDSEDAGQHAHKSNAPPTTLHNNHHNPIQQQTNPPPQSTCRSSSTRSRLPPRSRRRPSSSARAPASPSTACSSRTRWRRCCWRTAAPTPTRCVES